jgi:hypothetical protein
MTLSNRSVIHDDLDHSLDSDSDVRPADRRKRAGTIRGRGHLHGRPLMRTTACADPAIPLSWG